MKRSFVTLVVLIAIAISFAGGVLFSQHQQQNEENKDIITAYWDQSDQTDMKIRLYEDGKPANVIPFNGADPWGFLLSETDLGVGDINLMYLGNAVTLAKK